MDIDDWTITRTRQQHFTPDEIALIEKRFHEGVKATSVAREMQCSSRVIYNRYADLRDAAAAARRSAENEQSKASR
jgi:hypothetical protein